MNTIGGRVIAWLCAAAGVIALPWAIVAFGWWGIAGATLSTLAFRSTRRRVYQRGERRAVEESGEIVLIAADDPEVKIRMVPSLAGIVPLVTEPGVVACGRPAEDNPVIQALYSRRSTILIADGYIRRVTFTDRVCFTLTLALTVGGMLLVGPGEAAFFWSATTAARFLAVVGEMVTIERSAAEMVEPADPAAWTETRRWFAQFADGRAMVAPLGVADYHSKRYVVFPTTSPGMNATSVLIEGGRHLLVMARASISNRPGANHRPGSRGRAN